MDRIHSTILAGAALLVVTAPAAAQQTPVPSQCIAIAETIPQATFASFTQVQARAGEEVTITYAGHSTYLIDAPSGLRIATDYSGVYGNSPLPDIVTMNKAHGTHFTLNPDPGIGTVLQGWGDVPGEPAAHAVVIDDVYVRNVPTDIRSWEGLEVGGNSIFVFEIAGLCIGHLGHLHHRLENEHYAAIGRLDIVMVPVDGGLTLSIDGMSEITDRLQSSIVLPMHRFRTPIADFVSGLGDAFQVDYSDSRSFTISLRSLPSRPTVLILQGV